MPPFSVGTFLLSEIRIFSLFLTHDAAAEEDIVGGVDSAVAVQVGCKAFDVVGHYHAEYYAADDYIVGCIVFAVAVHIQG